MFTRNKIISLFCTFLILPVFFLDMWSYTSLKRLKRIEKKLLFVESKLIHLSKLKYKNEILKTNALNTDPSYLHKELESTPLLLSSQPIQIVEKQGEKNSFVTEKTEALANKIVVDQQEIRRILYKIEGTDPFSKSNPPLLIITDFSLKKNHSIGDNFYLLDFEFLKRDLPL
ncbi:MAG: hypothetical protein S4CHLAM7_11020 [Chlamydiae bacterium]|nr:hypothetical protein [Chlamydiota bacterium]